MLWNVTKSDYTTTQPYKSWMVLSKSRISTGSTLLHSLPCTSAENCFPPGILAERRATHHFCLPVQPESAPTRQPWHRSSGWLHDGDFLALIVSRMLKFHNDKRATFQSHKNGANNHLSGSNNILYRNTKQSQPRQSQHLLYIDASSLNIIQSESVLLPLLPRNL